MRKLLLTLFAASLFASCSTDLEVNAEWKDVTVVFGLLNQNDTAHYIKVTKAFLGDEDAFVMAMEPDSLYYTPGAITVSLEEYDENNLLERTIVFNRDESIPKDSGIFASPNQVLYKSTETISEDYRYVLKVTKGNGEGDVLESETELVSDFNWSGDMAKSTYIANFGGPVQVRTEVYFAGAVNARRFETIIRFFYDEENRNDPNDVTSKHIDWHLSDIQSSRIDGSEELGQEVSGESFFRFIKSQIPPNQNVWRHPKDVEIIVYAGSDQLNTYMVVNGPSNTIAQDKPEYTNVTNGLGLFASRNFKVRSDIEVSKRTHDSLRCGQFTAGSSWVSYEWDNVNDVHIDTNRFCQ